jgi:hypothetical protein
MAHVDGAFDRIQSKEGQMPDYKDLQDAAREQYTQLLERLKESSTEGRHRLVQSKDVRRIVYGASAVGRFNSWLAVLITKSVGTMWAAYLFAVIGLVSLPQAFAAFMKGDTVTGVAWLSQSFLQLVLLPIIIVGQNVISAAQDARAEADHETLVTLHTINVRQLEILEGQQKILLALGAEGD